MIILSNSSVKLPIYSFVTIFLILNHVASQSQLHDKEHEVLLKIKQYLKNPPFLSHWNPSNTFHCYWPEINCTSGSVTGLALVNDNITQTLPPFICDLKNLTHVDFNLNFIAGEFPTSLYNCSKLEYLDLSQNCFVGKIPNDIDRLSSLQYLSLSYNNFSGDIPVSIGRLKELRVLSLQDCLFDGTFPAEIANLSNLETLMFLPLRLPTNWTMLKAKIEFLKR